MTVTKQQIFYFASYAFKTVGLPWIDTMHCDKLKIQDGVAIVEKLN